jgi:hypothetical protein
MAADKATAIADIKAHREKRGGKYSQWYVGITSNPQKRLFGDHGVKEKGDVWIFRQCINSNVARAVEDYFLALGMNGGPGGGDDDSDYVYAYMIAEHTDE